VFKRSIFLLLAFAMLLCAQSVKAQGTFEFLGGAREVPDQFSPKYGIRYNTQGFDQPKVKWAKKLKKMQKFNVPDWALNEILQFPGSPDAIGNWVDSAFEQVQAQFMGCGGDLAKRAASVSAGNVYVTIMSSAFYEPYFKINVAGAFYPSTNEIKVLNIYYTAEGQNLGWLRHARDLLVWEMGNYFGVATKVLPEPRPEGWPCNAPPLTR
jgi:hypothetical protein